MVTRRQVLYLAAGSAALAATAGVTWAQAYPTRPVRILVGFAAGGNFDIVARLIGQWLSEQLQPAGHCREPARREQQYRDRSGRSCTRRRLHAPAGWCSERSQRDALRKTQLQFHQRPRPGCRRRSISQRHDGRRILSGEDGSRIHRLRESQSGQDQPRLVRQRDHATSRRRAVQDDDRCRLRPCSLSRRVASNYRSARRASAGLVRTLARRRSNTSNRASFAPWQ